MPYADLHVHTLYSDGTFTPRELIDAAVRAGLCAVAIVDHDTTDALPQACELSQSAPLEIIPGIELSAEYGNTEIHILGYLIDYRSGALQEKLSYLKKNRIERIYKMVEKLKGLGVALEPESVFSISGEGTVGRLHVARALLKAGFVSSTAEAFQRYIGDRSPAFVLGFKFSPAEAIRLIRESGGVPVLAHPYTLRGDEIIPALAAQGLMGLEVHYPEHSQSMVNFYTECARRHGLLITGGSDCHGAAKPDIKIGTIKVPYELVEKLKAAAVVRS